MKPTGVRENIEAFGGDPHNVTVFGESAGAVSVGNLLAMPLARGLFRKAILQSGTARCKVTLEAAVKMTEQLLAQLQIDRQNLSGLAALPAKKVIEAIGIFPRRAFGPVGDGVVIPEHPEKALYAGLAKDIPVLVGTNAHENKLFTYFDPAWKDMDESEIKVFLERTFGSSWAAGSHHAAQGDALHHAFNQALSQDLAQASNQAGYEDAMTHYVFTYPAIYFSEGQAKHGAPVWMYRFDYASKALGGEAKAFHGLEIPFVWNTLLAQETEELTGKEPCRFQLAELMHRAWIAFARHGDPNTSGLPDWPPLRWGKPGHHAFQYS